MGRSRSLPGREGTLIHPTILGMVYVPGQMGDPKKEGINYELAYTESPENLSLCFECIEKSLPKSQANLLQKVYKSFEAETAYRDQIERDRGKLIGFHEFQARSDLFKKYQNAKKALPEACIFTGVPVNDGSPFFTAYAINRHSSIGFNGAYQICGKIERYVTSFVISFDGLRDYLPSIFEELSCSMRRVPNPNFKRSPDTLTLLPGMKEALEQQTGKPIEQIIQEALKDTDNFRIIQIDSPKKDDKRHRQ